MPFEDSPEFRRLLSGDQGASLTRIALEIARDREPGLEPEAYLARIDALAERVRDRCPPGARTRHILGQINWVLFVEEQYRGNSEDYYDPRNSYLNRVIDRRLGIPISLSVLYMAIAERIGLEMLGVNLPAHFMIRTGKGPSTIYVDPFQGGAIVDGRGCQRRVEQVLGRELCLTEEHLAPCSTAAIVWRMLHNLKAIYLREHRYAESLPVLRRLVAIAPEDPAEHRDLGMVCLQNDRPGEALTALETYLQIRPDPEDADVVRSLLKVARRELAWRN